MEELQEMMKEMCEQLAEKAKEIGLENVCLTVRHYTGYSMDEIECCDADPNVPPERHVPHWQFDFRRHRYYEDSWLDMTDTYNGVIGT